MQELNLSMICAGMSRLSEEALSALLGYDADLSFHGAQATCAGTSNMALAIVE